MKAKTILTVNVPLAAIKRQLCAWDGCTKSIPMAPPLPRDWRWLAVWWGPATIPPWAAPVQDRDCVLCPKHARELDGLLKDIGQRLNKTEGSA